MKKLKLHLDELKVESFEMSSNPGTKNTVKGFAGTHVSCPTRPTSECDEPCNLTDCGDTCDGGSSCVPTCYFGCVTTPFTSCETHVGETCEGPGCQ